MVRFSTWSFESAVLGYATFGDVQFGHDFESGNQGIVHGGRQGVHGLIQDAVDSKFHLDASFSRFNMHVTGVFLERTQDNRIHQLDDRALIFRDPLHGEDVFASLIFLDQHGMQFLLNAREHVFVAFTGGQSILNRRFR